MDRGLSVESLVAANTTGSVVDSHRWTSVSFFSHRRQVFVGRAHRNCRSPCQISRDQKRRQKMNQKHNYIELSRLMWIGQKSILVSLSINLSPSLYTLLRVSFYRERPIKSRRLAESRERERSAKRKKQSQRERDPFTRRRQKLGQKLSTGPTARPL